MKSADIREAFLAHFESLGHTRVPSSPLVPQGDPTLLFTNAGMNQFKDTFLGRETRPYRRACSSQRCVRAGGKHNDLENVGYTARHHTFFEMLGNFSFGDYFKAEASRYAWDFLTGTLGLDPGRLWVTVHVSDDEAAAIWLDEIGISPERLSRLDEDNFWQMGDTGPCGPCCEIFYDHGPDVPGGPPGSEGGDLDRYVEIWNLVFMQYNRDSKGEMTPLPAPSVDTGMGLERIAAVMQGVHSNYETDLFQPLLRAAAGVLGLEPGMGAGGKSGRGSGGESGRGRGRKQGGGSEPGSGLGTEPGPGLGESASDSSLRVIADHIRSCAFLICDGVLPGNEGRGYVLRRIIRRAARHGNRLGADGPFFHKLVAPLVDEMGAAYPELREAQAHIEATLLREEEQFSRTLDKGMDLLREAIAEAGKAPLATPSGPASPPVGGSTGDAEPAALLPGDVVFKLYDTYGFPVDLTQDVAREHGLGLDMAGFEAAMAEQRRRSQQADTFSADLSNINDASAPELPGATAFTGHDGLTGAATIVALLRDGARVESLNEGEEGIIVLDRTPFYGESGGQVGDTGEICAAAADDANSAGSGSASAAGASSSPTGTKGKPAGAGAAAGDADSAAFRFEVRDTTKRGDHHLHHGVVTAGGATPGQPVRASVDGDRRRATARNHSATHLLHAALRQVLGKHVEQKGSLVDARRLRFDFSHPQPLVREQIKAVEALVNDQVWGNSAVSAEVMDMDAARAAGALALFGEKYGERVRVLRMGGDFSVELCGGTHVGRTGDIGLVRIVAEAGVAAGVRRIEAVSGAAALAALDTAEQRLAEICEAVKGDADSVVEKVRGLRATNRDLEREVERLQQKLATAAGGDLSAQAVAVNGTRVLAAAVEGADAKSLRATLDQVRDTLGSGVVLLAAVDGDKVALAAGVTADLTAQVKAGDLMREFAGRLGGKGGGRADMAQGAGTDVAALAATLQAVPGWVEAQLQ